MGYALELRAGSLDAVHQDLYHSVGEVEVGDEIREQVAAALAGDEIVHADAAVSRYLADVVRHHTHWWGGLQHSSSGGDSFREDFRAEIGASFGSDFAGHLLGRPVYNRLAAVDHPLVGWLSAAEVVEAAAHFGSINPPRPSEQSEMFRRVRPVVERAVALELAIFTLYI